ncbi:MAG: hypothetical protein Q8P05_06185 [Candidatus Diapherotrites archaeon]|nr:hypothetical protein [Candidatus Diapherotrites archaeon]MDZ4256458.1 hypothetical protein [archaeon]
MRLLGIGLAFLLVLSFASADALLVDPVVEKGKPGATFDLGKIEPGQGIEVILSKDTGYGASAFWTQFEWTSLSDDSLRAQDSQIGQESLVGRIQATGFTEEGTYHATLVLKGDPTLLQEETYHVIFTVQPTLVKGSLAVRGVEGRVNQEMTFDVLLVNDSSSPVRIRVQPELPGTWSSPREIHLAPRSFQNVEVGITPRFAGEKTFPLHLVNTETNHIYSTLQGNLTARPELKDRYAAGLYGFPFFTISLVANTLANAFFSLLL